jgi:hypothetical protein
MRLLVERFQLSIRPFYYTIALEPIEFLAPNLAPKKQESSKQGARSDSGSNQNVHLCIIKKTLHTYTNCIHIVS